MSYYKYAERDASAEVNWAEIGKNLTQTLQDEVKVREDKKAAIDAATREYDNTLNTAPQGEFQDGNRFTNEYVASQQKIRMMDDQLLKSGQMDLKTYTTRRQNGIDGTNQLFDLQTKFQEVYSERMKGIMDGSLTAQNAFEMSQVQAFGDFSKSQAVINNVDGRVSVGMTEMGEDGIKRVVPNSTIPTSVLLGKMGTPLASFDVNAETKRLVDSQGELVYTLFKAGTVTGAGSITELTGVDAIEKFGRGEWTEAATKVNSAIQGSIDAMLANPRNLPSLLTGQVGGYSSESFTYNKDEAAKDKNKILLKASPDLGPGVMDENGPNYKEQKAKVENWLTTSIKSQMDAKVGKSATAQAQRQDEPEWKSRKRDEDKAADTATNMIGKLYYGNDNQVQSAIDYLKGLRDSKGDIQFKDVTRDKTGVTVILKDGSSEKISFLDRNNKPRSQEDFIASAGPLLANQLDVSKSLQRGAYNKGAKFNIGSQGRGTTVEKIVLPTDIVSMASQDAVESIQASLPEGFTSEDTGSYAGVSAKSRNQVTITAPNGKKYVIQTKQSDSEANKNATTAVMGLEDFVNANKKTGTSAKSTNNKGVGSKY